MNGTKSDIPSYSLPLFFILESQSNYHEVKFINVFVNSLGIFGNSCDSCIQMHKDLDFDKKHRRYILKK